MTEQHPITPPPELVAQWVEYAGLVGINEHQLVHLATQAARWGADQELEACCEWVEKTLPSWAPHTLNEQLRVARRPKSPSLKEQALKALDDISIASFEQDAANIIRHALEQLDD